MHRRIFVVLAETRGDWDAAEAAYQESLALARELEEMLGTPRARRDLSVSLDNVGRVALSRNDLVAADDA